MLAARLSRAVRDLLDEYSEFRIVTQLEEASKLSAQRAQLRPDQYMQQARSFREWAQSVIARSKLERYPDDLQRFLNDSRYSSAFPSRIAKVVLAGFPDDQQRTISSPELGFYLDLARALHSELAAFDQASKKLNVEPITIPPNEISFDVIIPRKLFEDKADEFVKILSKFTNIMSYLSELATGSERSPTLTYTSASDIVTGLAIVSGAAWAFLNFYKLALEVAEKQLSLWKTLREFRALSLVSPDNIEEKTDTIINGALTQAVDDTVASIPPKVPKERVHEIKNAITKDARFVVTAIANGVRIGITIESLDRIYENCAETPELHEAPEMSTEMLNEMVREQKALEHQVAQSLALLGQRAPELPLFDNSGADEQLKR